MRVLPKELWPATPASHVQPLQVWRDADFLAMLYPAPAQFCPTAFGGALNRLTVVRAAGVAMDGRGRVVYRDGITWDDLMQVKRDCGLGFLWAVEVFPPDDEVVDVANMRHLWILLEAPAFAWRKDAAAESVTS